MKVTNIRPIQAEIVETDEQFYFTYRRGGPEHWEIQMGESWEACYDSDGKLETAYQAFKKEQGNDSRTSKAGGQDSA